MMMITNQYVYSSIRKYISRFTSENSQLEQNIHQKNVNVISMYASFVFICLIFWNKFGSFPSPPYNSPFKSSAHKDGH